MMHCKQMKPISSANNTQQKGQQIKTTLNKKGNNMTSKFHKVVHGFAFDKGVVNESKKQVAITVSLQFDRVLSSFFFKEKLFQFSCCRIFVLLLIYFTATVMSAGGRLQSYILHPGIECNFTLMMTLMTSKLMAMVMKMMMSALVPSCLNIL